MYQVRHCGLNAVVVAKSPQWIGILVYLTSMANIGALTPCGTAETVTAFVVYFSFLPWARSLNERLWLIPMQSPLVEQLWL